MVLIVVYLHTKFQVYTKFKVCTFGRCMERVPKFKSRSSDLDHAPFSPDCIRYVIFHLPDIPVKFRDDGFYRIRENVIN